MEGRVRHPKHKVAVTVSKTVQEQQYEPFTISVTVEGASLKPLTFASDVGDAITKQIDEKIRERLNRLAGEDE